MKTYAIEVKETLSRMVNMGAENKSDAVGMVVDKYMKQDIVLDSSDFDEVTFKAIGEPGELELPDHIMRALRERLDLEPDDESKDAEIRSMSPIEAVDAWLTWEGILGYTDSIIGLVEAAYGIVLEE